MIEKQRYRFIFRFDGGDTAQVKREVSPGTAKTAARELAKRAAKKVGSETAVCVWMGPVSQKIPAKVKAEIGNAV